MTENDLTKRKMTRREKELVDVIKERATLNLGKGCNHSCQYR
jgi:DNA repair photolyase